MPEVIQSYGRSGLIVVDVGTSFQQVAIVESGRGNPTVVLVSVLKC